MEHIKEEEIEENHNVVFDLDNHPTDNNYFLDKNIDIEGEVQKGKKENQFYGSNQAYDIDNEPPLLEDLGIDLNNIKQRIIAVLKLDKGEANFINDPDLSGPLIICFILGFLLLFSGKFHFGYIYGYWFFGTLLLYFVTNLQCQDGKVIPLYTLISILGYCLVPVVGLAFIDIFFELKCFMGYIIAFITSALCEYLSTSFLENEFYKKEKIYIVGYPIFMFYCSFVLITLL